MALTLLNDLIPYEKYFRLGYIEGITYRLDILNSRSNGVIQADSEFTSGTKKNIAFWQDFGEIARRDITVDSAQDMSKISRNERAEFKTFWKFPPVQFQWSAFKTADKMTPEEVYIMIGRKLAEKKLDYIVKQALMLAVAAISSGTTNTVKDYTDPAANFTVEKIPEAQALFGDAASKLKALVMHSAVFFPLVKDQILNYQFDTGSGLMLYGGTPATMGYPVIVTDNPELVYKDASQNLRYKTLLLADGAVRINDNGKTEALAQTMGGYENIKSFFQAEGDVWNEVKGYEYKGADIAANPTWANLTDPTRWAKWCNTYKDTAGVLIKSAGSVADVSRVLDVRITS